MNAAMCVNFSDKIFDDFARFRGVHSVCGIHGAHSVHRVRGDACGVQSV